MRRTNFATSTPARTLLVSLAFIAVAIAAAGATVLFVNDAHRYAKLTRALRAQLTNTAAAAEQVRPAIPEIPEAAEISALADRIGRLNAIAGDRSAPVIPLLAALEEALPARVWLQSLNYDLETARLVLSILSDGETELPEALKRIEDIDLLGSVILERQSRVRQGQRVLVQYDIVGIVR